MTKLTRNVAVAALGVVVAVGCGKARDDRPKREAVLPLLQHEAESLKKDGEKPDPKLGVEATWNIEGVEVQEQAGNSENPWLGTIRFKIDSKMKEVDGSVVGQSFDKRFVYVYSTVLNRWIIQYTPPSPSTAR